MICLTCISLFPFVDDFVRYLVLDAGVQDFPDVVRLPAAIGYEKTVQVRVVDDVPRLVDGGFERHHQIQFLVHGGFHQVDAGGGHGSI